MRIFFTMLYLAIGIAFTSFIANSAFIMAGKKQVTVIKENEYQLAPEEALVQIQNYDPNKDYKYKAIYKIDITRRWWKLPIKDTTIMEYQYTMHNRSK